MMAEHIGCILAPEGWMEMKTRTEQALEADLALACTSNNPCLVCGHYRPEMEKAKCDLMGWTCAWEWRGIQNE